MTAARLAPAARRDLHSAVRWILQDNPTAARALRDVVSAALAKVGQFPSLGFVRPDLADAPIRFHVLHGFPYVLVYDADAQPRLVLRVLHAARDLPELLQGCPGLTGAEGAFNKTIKDEENGVLSRRASQRVATSRRIPSPPGAGCWSWKTQG